VAIEAVVPIDDDDDDDVEVDVEDDDEKECFRSTINRWVELS
jgi:hypothetical protein